MLSSTIQWQVLEKLLKAECSCVSIASGDCWCFYSALFFLLHSILCTEIEGFRGFWRNLGHWLCHHVIYKRTLTEYKNDSL